MNDLAEFIHQAEADVQEYEALVVSADARIAAAQADAETAREKLSKAQVVLEWLRQRNQPEPAEPSTASQNGHSQTRMLFGKPAPEGPSKLSKCLDGLAGLGGTGSNKQISKRLLRDGVEIAPEHVRGLMKYASSKKPPLVTTEPGSGVWRLARVNGSGGAQ